MALSGAIAGRFRIVAPIGAGGMGEVYRAHDARLGRDVAIKVLPAGLASDAGRLRRFEQEAHAAAALNHPNILALYDLGEHDGAPYLVTELLVGESLRERIARGPLPVKEAVEVAVQVARGLAAAHAKGIVHRDLKPENLFLTSDGGVKILDFGLASLRGTSEPGTELTEAPTEAGLTQAGTVLGTAGYMAPEQVRCLPVDQRADIFAFGCVLYEMLTGRRAFAGETTADTLGAILREEPVGVEVAGSGVTPPLAQLVRRCLEKRPEARFSSAHDLALALAAAVSDVDASLASTVASARPRRRPIVPALGAALVAVVAVAAVLWLRGGRPGGGPVVALDPAKVMVAPFENRTGDASLEAVAARATDTVTQGLVELRDIEVVPAAGGATPGGEEAVRAAARAAGAGSLVTGVLYLTSDTLELRGRLVDVASGKPLYALEPERGPRGQPGAAIDRVRQRAMSAVLMHLGRAGFLGAVTRPPLYSAYQEYYAAFDLGMAGGLPHFKRATELDPEFWMPYMWLMGYYHFLGQEDKSRAVREHLRANQDKLGPPDQLMLASLEATFAGRPLEALRQDRALRALAPDDYGYTHLLAQEAVGLNRPRETLACIGDIDRFDWRSLQDCTICSELFSFAALAHHFLGEYEAELAVTGRGLEVYPDSLALRMRQLGALAALGRTDEVERVVDEAVRIHASGGLAARLLLNAAGELRVHGHQTEAARVAARGAEWFADQRGAWAGTVGAAERRVTCLRLAGREEEARALVRKTYEAHPDDLDATILWGIQAARIGDRTTAETVDRALAAMKDDPGGACWSRADIAAQLGDKDRAVELLREWMGQGGDYLSLHLDPDLEPLHGYPPYEELMKPKG